MGLSKALLFSAEQNVLATLGKALGHPARIAILQYMIKNRTCIVGDLTRELPLSQSSISQHLKELKNIGLVKGEIEGPSVCYCINEEMMLELTESLNSFIKDIKSCCR